MATPGVIYKDSLSRLFESPILGFEGESEFGSFVDGYQNKILLGDFPQCPIWRDLTYYYLGNDGFCWPVITLPVGNLNAYQSIVSKVSYNDTFLPLSAIYTCMPSFRRSGIDSFDQVPTFQQKINDLRVLIQVVENSQESCAGCVNGEVSKGHSCLAQLAREFRVSLSFTLANSIWEGVLRHVFHKTEMRRRHKETAIESLRKFSSSIADLSFLAQNTKWLVHRQGQWVPGSISQTVTRLAADLTPLRCRGWAPRANDCV